MLRSSRICVEKLFPHEDSHIHHLIKNSNSDHHAEQLKAAFFVSKLWPLKSTIKIRFLDQDTGVKFTSLKILENTRNNKGQLIPLDPIEKEIRGLSPKDAVKKIVKKRIEPIVG